MPVYINLIFNNLNNIYNKKSVRYRTTCALLGKRLIQ